MDKKHIFIGVGLLYVVLVVGSIILESCGGSKDSKESGDSVSLLENSDYESACYNGDFDEAHKILNKQRLELKNAIKDAQKFEKENELVKQVGEKRRWFKKNEAIYDTSNRDIYEGMIEECKGLAEEYLTGIIYVYDEEIRTVEVNFDEAQKANKIKLLKEQRITELKFFKNLYLENTWGRNCFEEIIEKVNGLIDEYNLE